MTRLTNKLKQIAIMVTILSLSGCSLFSNNGYEGGDHRGGGPKGPLTGSLSAKKSNGPIDSSGKNDSKYSGGDHRGGGPIRP